MEGCSLVISECAASLLSLCLLIGDIALTPLEHNQTGHQQIGLVFLGFCRRSVSCAQASVLSEQPGRCCDNEIVHFNHLQSFHSDEDELSMIPDATCEIGTFSPTSSLGECLHWLSSTRLGSAHYRYGLTGLKIFCWMVRATHHEILAAATLPGFFFKHRAAIYFFCSRQTLSPNIFVSGVWQQHSAGTWCVF